MLLKLLQDGFGSAMDLNCAEKILYGANWAYNWKRNLLKPLRRKWEQ